MSTNPKKGTLDRQAGVQGWPCDFRLLGTQRALVSIILHAESQSSKCSHGIGQERQ